MSTKTALMMVAALTTAGFATAVGASPVYTPASNLDLNAETVSLVGLDLHSVQGAKRALRRIHVAAEDVCGVPVGSVWAHAHPNPCVIAAVDRAVARLDNPNVTALHSGRGQPGGQFAAGGR
jgi:UrcA family protein